MVRKNHKIAPCLLREVYEMISVRSDEVHAFVKIKGCVANITRTIATKMKTGGCAWGLYIAAMAKSVTTPRDVGRRIGWVNLAVINTGGGGGR